MKKNSAFCLTLFLSHLAQANYLDFKKILGHANEFKEGDAIVGVAAQNQTERQNARKILEQVKISWIHENPIYKDEQQDLIWKDTDLRVYEKIKNWNLKQLKDFLLSHDNQQIQAMMPGLNSDAIACVVKLMSNAELIQVGKTIFNPLPNSPIGSKGYMGARIQPNSPTDNPEDIAWQVFNGFSYGVGDVLLGTNPVDSTPESVYQVETTLKNIIQTFKIQDNLAWSVLAHVDVQNIVEEKNPGSTDLFFQSIGGVEDANKTFGISTQKLIDYAQKRSQKKHGFYFESGQGADFTNQHGHGFDMVIHESRKYGLARAIRRITPWVIINDVAGFIGPEVFRTKEQLVRVCLEDIVMGKLHGLTIGLDICSTLHMSISLEDLEWCQNQIMPANPAYLMALPTRNDPMLSYLTTSYRDHVRIRNQFGYRVNNPMWEFFKKIEIIDSNNQPTQHFGDPIWVYTQYKIYQGDTRPIEVIYQEGLQAAKRVESRGVFLDRGQKNLEQKVQKIYQEAKEDIWTELNPLFIQRIPHHIFLKTSSQNRYDYISHPQTGEILESQSQKILEQLKEQAAQFNIQIIISDGLNARAIMKEGHLIPYLTELKKLLLAQDYRVNPHTLVIQNGRVRVGYRIGETLFGSDLNTNLSEHKAVIHIIGERPGNGHQTFSAYLVNPTVKIWKENKVDHDMAKLVSGISNTSLKPLEAAQQTVELLASLSSKSCFGSTGVGAPVSKSVPF